MANEFGVELTPAHLNLFRRALEEHDIPEAVSARLIDRVKLTDFRDRFQLDPGVLRPIDPGPVRSDPGIPAPTAPAPSGEPPQLAFLASLVSEIPQAVDGAVITADYHNKLRAVVRALVELAFLREATIGSIQNQINTIAQNLQGLTGRVDTTHAIALTTLTQDIATLRAKVDAALAVAQKPPAAGPFKLLTDDFKLDPVAFERVSTDLDKRTATVLIADAVEKARNEGRNVDVGGVESSAGEHIDRNLFRRLGRGRFG